MRSLDLLHAAAAGRLKCSAAEVTVVTAEKRQAQVAERLGFRIAFVE